MILPALRGVLVTFAFVTAAYAAGTGAPDPGGKPLPTVTLKINGHQVTAEVARTADTRATGLMNRFSLKPDTGMLFVFEQAEPLAFWMKNTFIPLSIAFIDPEGRILNIEDMAPQTETSHCSKQPVRMVLEMNQGWFAKRGLKAGSKLTGSPFSG